MTGSQRETAYVTINLQWSVSSSLSGTGPVHYEISSDLGGGMVWKTAKESTSATIRVPYNVNNSINVSAVNCAGSSTPAQLHDLSYSLGKLK